MRGTRGFARPLAVRQRLCQLVGIRVDGTGTASLLSGGKEAVLTDNGVGDYILTLVQASVQTPVVVGVAPLTAGTICQVFALSTTAVRIKTFAVDGTTAQDADFHVTLLLSDADAVV